MSVLDFYSGKADTISRLLLEQAKTYRTEILIGFSIALLLRLILNRLRTRRLNFPPGPRGLPIVGYLPFMSKDTHLDLIELGKKYGSIFSVKLGSEKLVILHDAEIIREALTKPELQGRQPKGPMSFVVKNSPFFARDNHVWKEQRRFVVQSMRDLGLGKSKIEDEILDEISHLLNVLSETKGNAIDLVAPLSSSMSNNICALVFGKRYDFSDPVRKTLDIALDNVFRSFSQTSVAAFFPSLLSVPVLGKYFLKSLDTCVKNINVINGICHQEVEKHRKNFNSRNVTDFIDSYLLEMETRKEKNLNSTFDDITLKATVYDLFAAGSETVRTSILWCIYIIAAYPDVQKKVQKEIMHVIGSERSPQYLDQKEMPFTHAVIWEVMRWKTIVPLNVVRCVTEDTKVRGYDLPKGTAVLANLWNAHHDPKLWDKPDSFKPERFLSRDGKSVVKPANYTPFSIGKRSCPGEAMANMEIFLYFTSILQKFDVVLPEGVKPDFKGNLGIVYAANPYKVKFQSRS